MASVSLAHRLSCWALLPHPPLLVAVVASVAEVSVVVDSGFGLGLGLGYPYYGYGGYYPYYGDAGVCYEQRRRVLTPYGWRIRRVSVCE